MPGTVMSLKNIYCLYCVPKSYKCGVAPSKFDNSYNPNFCLLLPKMGTVLIRHCAVVNEVYFQEFRGLAHARDSCVVKTFIGLKETVINNSVNDWLLHHLPGSPPVS